MIGTRFPKAHRWVIRFGANAAAALALVAANLAAAQVPSVISIARAGPTPTNASSVDFSVTFSEPVTGVDAADFVLTTTGTLAGASVTGAAGTGDTRTVSVGTGTGNGALRLDLVDDDSITDGSSNALGGAGAGNGSFSAGETYAIDRAGPAVVSVTVPASGVYVAGDNLDFTVNLDEAATVNTAGGAPFIPLTIGATPRQASYISGSGTSAPFFRYTIQVGDVDVDGIAVGGAIATNGATIRDAAGNDANPTLNGVGSTAGVLVDPFRTVTPSAGPNGSIAPSTPQTVTYGNAAVFTVTPGPGYAAVVGGTCGGTLVGSTYTTNAITADCSVAASFAQTYTVTPTGGANGSISPSIPQTIVGGAAAVFTVTPDTGYSAAVGGTCGGTLVGDTYTTNPITASCTVVASFAPNSYTVTPNAGSNGAISPSTPQSIAHGATAVFTVMPDTGYAAAVGGTCGGTLAGNTYTTNAITSNCTVAAAFNASPVTTFTAPSATGTGNITASFTGGGPACTFTTAQMIPVQGHASSPPAETAPAQVAFPHGLFDFTLGGCTPGSTVTMTIAYPTALPPNAWYWKYGPTASQPAPHWYVLLTGLSGTPVTFTLTDGGVGDDDLTANGTIVDQGGPGTGAGGAVQVPTLSAWAMAALSALLLLAGLRRARGEAEGATVL